MRRSLAAALCGAALVLAAPPGAPAAPGDPLFVLIPQSPLPPAPPAPPPNGRLNGPCGLVVDSSGRLHVSDYHHNAIDVFNPPPPPPGSSGYVSQIAPVAPFNGPCGLAFDAIGNLYVNVYHEYVRKFGGVAPGPIIDADRPTGVAVDPARGRVYVNNRTHVSVYDLSGAPILDEGQPLRIGEGTLGEGYGLAVSGHAATEGRLYVPDAATDTVKAYDPLTDPVNPVAEIKDPFGKPFASLRDSAIAVDRVTGEIYFADNTQPKHTERPQAILYVYRPDNTWRGFLKYRIVDALPPGIAVDNSTVLATQGRVYVTSGNTDQAGVYAYPPGSALTASPLPPSFSLGLAAAGSGSGQVAASLAGLSCASACEAQVRSGAEVTLTATPERGSAFAGWSGAGCEGTGACVVEMTQARQVQARFAALAGPPPPASRSAVARASEITQKGTLRLTVEGDVSPKRLPRRGVAPIAVSIGGEITTTDQSLPPQLKSMRIELNRRGRLDYAGLPVCEYHRIQPASSARALAGCRPALVGRGRFSALITLTGQEPYATEGRLLIFNGTRKGKPVLFGHIYSARPFANSFVIVFEIEKLSRGTYGTVMTASPPKAFRKWGNLTGIEMTLERRYRAAGKRRSYVSAGCPAPKGFPGALFALARTSFDFVGGRKLTSVLVDDCKVRG